MRVNVLREGDEVIISPVASKGSSLITTLTKASGFVVVDEDRESIEAGEKVRVYLF